MKNIYAKLFRIQQELKPISKDLDNPFFHSKYFDVNALLETLKPIWAKEKLLVLQPLSDVAGRAAIKTIIVDTESGEELSFTVPLVETPDAQKFGAAVTYTRRFSLVSLFMIQGDEDDDGNSAVTRPKTGEPFVEPFADNEPANVLKKCPKCGKGHKGKYPKCLSCWQSEQK